MAARNKTVFKKKELSLLCKYLTALSVVGGAFLSPLALSQNSNVEEVLVTGQRKSIESAQQLKRDADVVVDSVTAVDIGALPDRSVSEALQRIPGVQLQRTNENRDPARLAAEGGAVFVRGLSWVRTELNGRDIYSASSGRSLGFEDVSADLMSGVDVYKSPSANMVEGGIGGTVNLRTRLPFDSDDMIVAGSYDYNYAELYDEAFESANGLFSNIWDSEFGKIGLLLSVSKAEIGNRTDSVSVDRYEDFINGSGETYYAPVGLGFRRIDWDQERNAYSGALQWAPNDQLTFTLQALRAEANPRDWEHAGGINSAFGNAITDETGNYTYNNDNFLMGGQLNDAAVYFTSRYGQKETFTQDISFNVKFENERWKIAGDVQRVTSEADVESMTAFTYLNHPDGDWWYDDQGNQNVNPSSGVTVNFDVSGRPVISVSDAQRQQDPSQYFWGAAMDHLENNDAKSVAGEIDAEYSFQFEGLFQSVAFGARVIDKDTTTRQSGWNWSLVSHQFWGGGDSALVSDHATDFAHLETFDNFYDGDVNVPFVGWVANRELLSSNLNYYYKLREPIENTIATQYWGWRPLDPSTAYDLDPQADNVSAGINDQNEKTEAAYVMLKFADEAGSLVGLPFDGNIGVRYVKTSTTAVGRGGAGGVSELCGQGSQTADCIGASAFVSAFNTQFGDYNTYEKDYDNFLPSLNLRLHLKEDLQARLGLSRAMIRPSFSQARPYTNLSFSFEQDIFDPELNGYQGTGTVGNFDLEPTLADQVDASLEWYFTNSGSLTLSLFYKELSDYIMAATTIEEYTYGGETYKFEVTQQMNAEEGKLKGFELGYSQFYQNLPEPWDGLGVQANYTYISNSGGANTALNVFDTNQVTGGTDTQLPIEGMSKSSYNIALMYEKYDISARLAYNWRERYLLTTSAANINRPVWFNDYGQLDASVFYSLNSHIKVGLQVTNLLAEETELEIGDTKQSANYSWTQGDRRMAFVIRGQF